MVLEGLNVVQAGLLREEHVRVNSTPNVFDRSHMILRLSVISSGNSKYQTFHTLFDFVVRIRRYSTNPLSLSIPVFCHS